MKWVVGLLVVGVLAYYLYTSNVSTAPANGVIGGNSGGGAVGGGSGVSANGTGTGSTAQTITIPTVGGGSYVGHPGAFTPYSNSGAGNPIVGNDWTTAAENAPAGTTVGMSNLGPVVSQGNGVLTAPDPPPGPSPIPLQQMKTKSQLANLVFGARATTSGGAPTANGSTGAPIATTTAHLSLTNSTAAIQHSLLHSS